MTWMTRRHVTALLLAFFATGCGLLDVSDPTAVEETELANANGADLMRRNALARFSTAVGAWVAYSALFSDELFSDPHPSLVAAGSGLEELFADQRRLTDGTVGENFAAWGSAHDARRGADEAIVQLRQYGGAAVRDAHIGQMLTLRGYVTLTLAENVCPGFPLNEVVDGRIVYEAPITTTDEVFERALADFDSAIVYAGDSARIGDAARIGRARTLLGLGRFTEAGAAAALVPTAYVWNVEFSTAVGTSNPLAFRLGGNRRGVADLEGGQGLAFVSADDPRVQTDSMDLAYDGVTVLYGISKYPNADAPLTLASGVEARLIEAEAALQADPESGTWLTILNDLRATQASPALADTTDPGTEAGRVDLLFRERAYWLFATGHRLGDLRRLVQRYGRDAESVFPTGTHYLGDTYGTAISLPFPAALEAAHNPAVTGCTGS